MLKKPQIVGIMFVIVVFALVATGIKSPVTGADFEKLTEAEATARWMTSGHGDETSEAFRHWDDEEDASATLSNSCARCHGTAGFVEFITTGAVAGSHLATDDIGIECTVCHSSASTGALRDVTSVTFPSGVLVEELGNEAICMQCHQARSSNTTVSGYIDAAIAAATGAFDDDTISSKLRFSNSHYAVAGATNMGTVAKGGAEYPGQTYDARFAHVDGYNACSTCHDPHTLKVKLDHCSTCHTDAGNTSYWGGIADPKNIRFFASWLTDYDGDGDTTEGIYYEIDTLKHTLWDKISAYALKIAGVGIVQGDGYPYFFKDTNGNGVADAAEQERANAFSAFTVRLTRALFNYQFVSKDHGGFAHGGKYQIQLLYDGIMDLNIGLGEPAAPAGLTRDTLPNRGDDASRFQERQPRATAGTPTRGDEGHFDGSGEAWRHWDEDESVSGSCAKCHSATGLADYLDNGTIDDTHMPANGMLCTTCHTSPPALRSSPTVTFPSGAILDMGDSSNLCMQCHQGRGSHNTIASKIAGTPPFTFSNIHYFPVAAILFGSEAKGGYQYPGKTYAGKREWPNHNGRFGTCVQCHMGSAGLYDGAPPVQTNHNVHKPNQADCVGCHGFDSSQPNPGMDPTKFKFSGIRPGSTPDYDGDGNTTESVENEIKALEAALIAQAYNYATNVLGTPILYDSHSYPYWFKDTNGNGVADPGEINYGNQFRGFDAILLPAAYNYHTSIKEPHGFIHNSQYVAQLLVDSIGDLGGNVAPYTWR